MSEIQRINEFESSLDDTLDGIYEDLYQDFIEHEDIEVIREVHGMKDRLNRMIVYFSDKEREEYEKCARIKKIMEKCGF